jgi:hypothetical protein
MNNLFNMLSPQLQQQAQSIFQQAQASGNPQQFLMQRYGNDSNFMQGLKIFNEKGIDGLNQFLTNQINR